MNIDTVINNHKSEKGSLLAILQEVQEIYGWLSPETLDLIAEKTGLPKSKIMGAATFYAGFRLNPPGKHPIQLCQGTACHVNGSAEIGKSVRAKLEETEDGLFTCENVACLGCCSLSPVMTIDGRTYGHLTSEKALEIITAVSHEM